MFGGGPSWGYSKSGCLRKRSSGEGLFNKEVFGDAGKCKDGDA